MRKRKKKGSKTVLIHKNLTSSLYVKFTTFLLVQNLCTTLLPSNSLSFLMDLKKYQFWISGKLNVNRIFGDRVGTFLKSFTFYLLISRHTREIFSFVSEKVLN